MPAAGVEPALPLGERDFKSRASANSAMPACTVYRSGLTLGQAALPFWYVYYGGPKTAVIFASYGVSGPSGTRTQDRPVMSREL